MSRPVQGRWLAGGAVQPEIDDRPAAIASWVLVRDHHDGVTVPRVERLDLSRVDEIGWTQLMPGSGHGVGGFVAVSKFEVWGKPVPRMNTASR
jgi:hypothetical protein